MRRGSAWVEGWEREEVCFVRFSPPNIPRCVLLSGDLLVAFWWCLTALGRSNVHVCSSLGDLVGAPAAQRKNAREEKRLEFGSEKKKAQNVGPDNWTAHRQTAPHLTGATPELPPLSAAPQTPFPPASPPPQRTNTPNLCKQAKVAQNKDCPNWSYKMMTYGVKPTLFVKPTNARDCFVRFPKK